MNMCSLCHYDNHIEKSNNPHTSKFTISFQNAGIIITDAKTIFTYTVYIFLVT